jgi:hypothetical protein
MYQHDMWYLPSNIGGNFVKGLTCEHLGKDVDWAKFGEETNHRQRNCYGSEKRQLEALKEKQEHTGKGIPLKTWRKVKTELGVRKRHPACLRSGGLAEDSKSLSISTLSSQKEKKPSTSDVDCQARLEENMLMFKILLMEIEGARFREQEIVAERDCSIERLRGAELLVGSL